MPSHFPFGAVGGGIEAVEIAVFVRLRQHQRRKGRQLADLRPFRASIEPGEQRRVGRRQPVPDFLDALGGDPAPLGECDLGQPRRHPDAQRTGDQFQQGPPPGRVKPVEPRRQMPADLMPPGQPQGFNDLAQARNVAVIRPRRIGRPDQRHRLGQVADKVVGPAEQFRIDPRHRQRAHLARFRFGKDQFAGQGGERPAPLGIGRRRKIFLHQPQLAITRRGEQERVDQCGKAVHSSSVARNKAAGRYVAAAARGERISDDGRGTGG